MNVIYPAIFHKENGEYWCEFPDLPGCQTYNDTLEKTINGAVEALSGYSLTLLEQGRKLPEYSKIESWDRCFCKLYFCTNPMRLQKHKKTLSRPAWLDIKAKKMNLNFSQILQEALLKKVETTL